MRASTDAPQRADLGVRPLNLKRPTRAGLGVLFFFMTLIGVWSALAPLDRAAIAPGLVKVSGERKVIQHLEGGIVSELLVSEGERVEAGQVLLRLDGAQATAQLDLLEGRRLARLAQAARLRAERDGLDEIPFPAELLAEEAPPSIQIAVAGQRDVFQARRTAYDGSKAILEQRILQTEEEIKGLEGLIAAQDSLIELIDAEASDLQSLFDKGFTTRERLLALRRRQAEVVGERAANVAALARLKRSIAEIAQQIVELRTGTVNEAVSELSQVESELFDLIQQLHSARDVLQRLEIRSPVSGTIVGQQVHTAGGVVRPGEPLMQLVPMDDRLVVEAHIRPEDIDAVAAGQLADIRLSAFSYFEIPSLQGVVEQVSADRLVDSRTGGAYFAAIVSVSEDEILKLGGRSLMPGLTAEVMIATGGRTLLGYLAEPLARSFYRALRE